MRASEIYESILTEAPNPNLLMLRTTHQPTLDAIKQIQSVMRQQGYKGQRRNQSAMFEIAFEGPGPQITIDGWHGNGKYGEAAALMTVYVEHKPLIDLFHVLDDTDTTPGVKQSYWASEEKMQGYLARLKQVVQMFTSGTIFK